MDPVYNAIFQEDALTQPVYRQIFSKCVDESNICCLSEIMADKEAFLKKLKEVKINGEGFKLVQSKAFTKALGKLETEFDRILSQIENLAEALKLFSLSPVDGVHQTIPVFIKVSASLLKSLDHLSGSWTLHH